MQGRAGGEPSPEQVDVAESADRGRQRAKPATVASVSSDAPPAPATPSAPSTGKNEGTAASLRGNSPRHTVPSRDAEPRRPRDDAERPVVRSVEPVAARAVDAGAVDAALIDTPNAPSTSLTSGLGHQRSGARPPTSAALSARLAEGTAILRANSRILVGIALAAVGVLLGVAIGYSAAGRGTSRSAAAAGGRGPDTAAALPLLRSPGVRESVSAGGIAPPATAGTSRARASRPAARGDRTARTPTRSAPAGPAVRQGGVTPDAGRAAVVPPSAASATTATDAAAAQIRRDSTARADSLASEREAIRREIEMRRARVDSIERTRIRLDSLRRAEQAGGRPPRR
jgi:hypothetical protein